MDFSAWRRHYEDNHRRPLPVVVDAALGLTDVQRDALTLTLARFQLGETGEGRIGHEINAFHHPAIDDDYREALRGFVREEGRHAAILGRCVKALGGAPLASTWTELLFRRGRRLVGVRTKLVVLLSAEVIAVGFYGALVDRLPPGPLKDALGQIVGDEAGHLAFHVDFFRAICSGPVERAAFLAAWQVIANAACATVLVDHRATLRAFDVDLVEMTRVLRGHVADVAARVVAEPEAELEVEGAAA
jgi:hypothetical protein